MIFGLFSILMYIVVHWNSSILFKLWALQKVILLLNDSLIFYSFDQKYSIHKSLFIFIYPLIIYMFWTNSLWHSTKCQNIWMGFIITVKTFWAYIILIKHIYWRCSSVQRECETYKERISSHLLLRICTNVLFINQTR